MRSAALSRVPSGPGGRRISWVWQLLLTVPAASTLLPHHGKSRSSNAEIFFKFYFACRSRCLVTLRCQSASAKLLHCVQESPHVRNVQSQAILPPYSVVLLVDDYWRDKLMFWSEVPCLPHTVLYACSTGCALCVIIKHKIHEFRPNSFSGYLI